MFRCNAPKWQAFRFEQGENDILARTTRHDELLFCENCGISFLWPKEEHQEAAEPVEPPVRCPGCRQVLPPPAYERGLVKWFNHRKHYGFIIRKDHPDLFVHASELDSNVHLHPGDLVEFTVAAGERGPMAKSIRVIGHFDEEIIA